MRARYYDPGLGRFLSRDATEIEPFNPRELNRYVYAANDPVNMSDPTGTSSATDLGLEIAFVGLSASRSLAYLGVAIGGVYAAQYVLVMMAQALPGIAGPTPWPDPLGGLRDALDRLGERSREIKNVATAILAAILAKNLEQEITREPTRGIPRRYSLDTNALVALEHWMVGVDDRQGSLLAAKIGGHRVYYTLVAASEFFAKGSPADLAAIAERYNMTLIPTIPGELIDLVTASYTGKHLDTQRINDIQIIAAAIVVNSTLLTRDDEILRLFPSLIAERW